MFCSVLTWPSPFQQGEGRAVERASHRLRSVHSSLPPPANQPVPAGNAKRRFCAPAFPSLLLIGISHLCTLVVERHLTQEETVLPCCLTLRRLTSLSAWLVPPPSSPPPPTCHCCASQPVATGSCTEAHAASACFTHWDRDAFKRGQPRVAQSEGIAKKSHPRNGAFLPHLRSVMPASFSYLSASQCQFNSRSASASPQRSGLAGLPQEDSVAYMLVAATHVEEIEENDYLA